MDHDFLPVRERSLRLGDIFGTLGIVDESFNVLMASKVHDPPEVQLCLNKYRQLAFRVHQHMESVIANLADDLNRSPHPGDEAFRAEIMALLWTLGFVPECQSMRASNYVPSRSFLKKIVWMAMERLWCGPLTQYVLLEMKDKPPFNIREHRPLFDKINERYGQYMPDEIWDAAPSEIYAQTLIAWFKGNLNHDKVGAT
jgi:hypothetical protein